MSPLSLSIGFAIGALIAALVTYLLVDRRSRNATVAAATARAIAEGNAASAVGRVAELEADRRQLADQRVTAESSRAAAMAERDAERQRSVDLLRQLEDHARFVATTESHLQNVFAKVSSDALQAGNKQFVELAQAKFGQLTTQASNSLEQKRLEMQGLLQPVRQTLDEYRAQLDKLEVDRKLDQTSVRGELAKVAQTQEVLSRETSSLSRALSRSEVRGRWGELQLRNLMEASGLTNRVDFDLQVDVAGDDGRLRPDCVVRLPNDRRVVVDAKVVLDAFADAARCDPADVEARAGHLRRHARQVRARIDELAGKAYWDRFAQSADYVVLFMPGEPFLYAAVEHDADLIEYGLRKRVLVASPTTLIGLLRVIEHGWARTDANENIDRIHALATELHKRVAMVADHFATLGGALNDACEAYNATLGSLERNVFAQARKIEKLGAGSAKELPELETVDDEARPLGKQWSNLPADDGEEAQPAA